jgi:hypothetical protein
MAKQRKKKVRKAKAKKAKRRAPARKAAKPSRKKNNRVERELEEGLRETFPGSDALAVTDPTRGIKE